LNDTDGLFVYTFVTYQQDGADRDKLALINYAPDNSSIDTRYLHGGNFNFLKEKTQPNIALQVQDKASMSWDVLVEKGKESK